MRNTADLATPSIAFDDHGGQGHPVILLPGAGDLRSEYRFIVAPLRQAGHRVIVADLPGHGDSPLAGAYSVASTADAIVGLIRHLQVGPVTLVGCSFAPAAAVWVAVEHPDLVDGVVAISPHFTADESPSGRAIGLAIKAILRGPWAGGLWAKLYAGWYKSNPPSDLASEIDRMRALLADPGRRKAVRQTLTADRDGVGERMDRVAVPTLTIFGSRDDHFDDPEEEAKATADRLRGSHLVVEGAGHYPHVESPEPVAAAIVSFLAHLR